MTPKEIGNMMKKLHNGEKVICPDCKKGIIKTPYNPSTSKFFKCDNCSFMINED